MAKDKKFEKYKELLKGEAPSECQACGGPLSLEEINLEDYQGGKLYMMEKVPAYACQSCGEIMVPAPIIKEFTAMIQTAKHRKPRIKQPHGTTRKKGKK